MRAVDEERAVKIGNGLVIGAGQHCEVDEGHVKLGCRIPRDLVEARKAWVRCMVRPIHRAKGGAARSRANNRFAVV